MVETPQKSILRLNGRDDIYHIEISPETSTKTLASTEGLEGFEIEYTCPNCLERNSSVFTNFPESVSVLCSSCQRSHRIYDFSDDSLVVITRKIEGLLKGLRTLCRRSQLREISIKGNLSTTQLLLFSWLRLLINRLRFFVGAFGFFVGLSSLHIPELSPYAFVVSAILISVSLFKKEFLYDIQSELSERLSTWATRESDYLVSTELLTRNSANNLFDLFS